MTITFRDEQHKQDYLNTIEKMKSKDRYNQMLAYLLTLDSECFNHISDLYDFERDEIKAMGATNLAWQTGTSIKTTRLAFNLWSGIKADYDKNESADDSTIGYYAVDEIFCSSYALYYLEAIKLRYPEYTAD